MSNYATLQIKDELARLPGVGDIYHLRRRDYSMRLWLNPEQLASRNLTAGDVIKAVQEQNVQVAAGIVGGPPLPPDTTPFQFTVNAQGRLIDPEQFGEIIVKTGADGSVTRVKDVARVELGAADYSTSTHFNGSPAVGIPIFQLPGSNSIATANAIYQKMEELKKNFPIGRRLRDPLRHDHLCPRQHQGRRQDALRGDRPGGDGGAGLLAKLAGVDRSAAGDSGVAGRHVRRHGCLRFSLNNLSLFGLVLAIGIVVDDAIVVVENVDRWIEHGLSPARSGLTGDGGSHAGGHRHRLRAHGRLRARGVHQRNHRPVLPAIRADHLVLHALVGVQLADAQPRSGGDDPQAARGEKGLADAHHRSLRSAGFSSLFNNGLERSNAGYVVDASKHVVAPVGVGAGRLCGLIVLTYFGFKTVPLGFIPQQDQGYLIVAVQLPDASSIDRTDAVIDRLSDDRQQDARASTTRSRHRI